jgi:hypothetical protein
MKKIKRKPVSLASSLVEAEETTEEQNARLLRELKEARKQIAQLEEDRVILKKAALDSIGQRNLIAKHIRRRPVTQRLPWPPVHLSRHAIQIALCRAREIGSPREILAKKTVCVLVRPALPRTARVAKVDWHPRRGAELLVGGELGTAIPGERRHGATGQAIYPASEGGDDAPGVLALQPNEHQEPRATLDERRNVAVVGATDQVSLPVPRSLAIGHDFGAIGD